MLWAVALTLLLGSAIAFVLLPIVVAVRIAQDGEDTALDVRVDLAAWWGALGLVARRQTDRQTWELSPRLLGMATGPWFGLGGSTATSDPAPAAGDVLEEPEPTDTPPENSDTQSRPAPTLWQRLQRDGSLLLSLLRPAWRMVRSFPRAFAFKQVRLSGQVGLADPASTGQVQGLVCALRDVLPRQVDVDLAPDFVTPGLRGQAAARVHMHLSKLLYYLARFTLIAAIHWSRSRILLWRTDRARTTATSSTT